MSVHPLVLGNRLNEVNHASTNGIGNIAIDSIVINGNNYSLVSLNSSQVFQITYVGGDGNDVALIQQRVPAPPSLGTISQTGPGQIQVTGTGVPGWVYTIEANEDLGNPAGWQPIGTAVADLNGEILFVDPDAANHVMRFYRFKAP